MSVDREIPRYREFHSAASNAGDLRLVVAVGLRNAAHAGVERFCNRAVWTIRPAECISTVALGVIGIGRLVSIPPSRHGDCRVRADSHRSADRDVQAPVLVGLCGLHHRDDNAEVIVVAAAGPGAALKVAVSCDGKERECRARIIRELRVEHNRSRVVRRLRPRRDSRGKAVFGSRIPLHVSGRIVAADKNLKCGRVGRRRLALGPVRRGGGKTVGRSACNPHVLVRRNDRIDDCDAGGFISVQLVVPRSERNSYGCVALYAHVNQRRHFDNRRSCVGGNYDISRRRSVCLALHGGARSKAVVDGQGERISRCARNSDGPRHTSGLLRIDDV